MPKQMMTDDNMEKLIAYRELDSSCVFVDDGDGFLSLTLDETVYRPVDLIRLLPYDRPDEYISCVCKEQELGIIRRIADFPEEQQRILQHQLSFRYYTPVIEKIISVREKMWFVFIKVVVDGQKKELCTRDLYHNIRFYNSTDLLLTDVDENRYLIRNFRQQPAKMQQKIEIYL